LAYDSCEKLPQWANKQALNQLGRAGFRLAALDGATVEGHLQDVGNARTALAEPVTPDLDPGARWKRSLIRDGE
jgi:hypothetical protein